MHLSVAGATRVGPHIHKRGDILTKARGLQAASRGHDLQFIESQAIRCVEAA
jgi:hypothetical protein